MFCGNCGNQIVDGHKFCTNCGDSTGDSSNVYAPASRESELNHVVETAETINPPQIGLPIEVFRKINVGTYFASSRPDEFKWINGLVNLILAKDALIVIAASPISRTEKALEVASIFGSTSIGAGLCVLPIAVVADAYNYFTKNNGLDQKSLETLFLSGNAIWIRKSAATFHFIESKGGMFFGDHGCLYAASGEFETALGNLKMCVGVSDSVLPVASDYRKAFKKTGYDFITGQVKKTDDLWVEMKKRFG